MAHHQPADRQANRPSDSCTRACPDCESGFEFLNLREFFSRREFLTAAGATAVAAGTMGLPNVIVRAAEATDSAAGGATASGAGPAAKTAPETLVKQLYDSLRPEQSKAVAFDWDYTDERGLLRTRVSNNWNITKPTIASDFYSKDQQEIIRAIYEGLFHPDWVPKIDKQLTGRRPAGMANRKASPCSASRATASSKWS